MALWKDVAGYEHLYLVSDEGEILSLPKKVQGIREQNRKAKLLKKGRRGHKKNLYEFVILTDSNGIQHHESVHRIVAKAFLPNPEGLPEINHKDENSLNNRVENLEWCDRQYNIDYSKSLEVVQFEDGVPVARYKSISYAGRMTGISRKAINNALRGYSKSAGGYKWQYAKGGNES